MKPELLENIFGKKKIRLFLLLSYLLIILVLYSTFLLSAQKRALESVKGDMQKKLDTFLLSMESEFNKKLSYAAGLVNNNSLRMPLGFGFSQQVKEYLDGDEGIRSGEYRVLAIDAENNQLFNNTGVSGDISGLDMGNSQYSGYLFKDGLFRISYMPAFIEFLSETSSKKRVGAVISAYDFIQLSSLVPEDEKTGYIYFAIAQDHLRYIIDEHPRSIDIPPSEASLKNNGEGFRWAKFDGRRILMLTKHIPLLGTDGKFALSIAVPSSLYRSTEAPLLLEGLRNSTFIALFITIIMTFVYYMLSRDFSRKLEIQSLRTQRHDFSKHIDVIRGMVALDEIDELKSYVESLGTKVSLRGELTSLGCFPLSVLLEEKQEITEEKDLVFKISVRTGIKELGVQSDDLCSIMGNILDNAIEACTITDNAPGRIEMEIGRTPGYFYFKVSNTGKIIPEGAIQNIFKPGYSTKPGRKGRGMGLYIVSRALKKYKGSIKVDSIDNRTTFTVYFPVKKI